MDALQAALQNMKGILDAIVTLRYQQLHIMERLNELSLGIRGQNTGKDIDHPPIAFPTAANHMAPFSDMLQALDAPQETFIHLGLAVRQKQDPTSTQLSLHHIVGILC